MKCRFVARFIVRSGAAPTLTVKSVGNSNRLSDQQSSVLEDRAVVNVATAVACAGTIFEASLTREGYLLAGGRFGVGEGGLVVERSLPVSADINRSRARALTPLS